MRFTLPAPSHEADGSGGGDARAPDPPRAGLARVRCRADAGQIAGRAAPAAGRVREAWLAVRQTDGASGAPAGDRSIRYRRSGQAQSAERSPSGGGGERLLLLHLRRAAAAAAASRDAADRPDSGRDGVPAAAADCGDTAPAPAGRSGVPARARRADIPVLLQSSRPAESKNCAHLQLAACNRPGFPTAPRYKARVFGRRCQPRGDMGDSARLSPAFFRQCRTGRDCLDSADCSRR